MIARAALRRPRRSKVFSSATVLAVTMLAASQASFGGAVAAAAPVTSTSVTVTGPADAYDPAAKALRTALPTATVSSTENLVDQTVHVSWTDETPTSVDLTNPADTADATVDPNQLINSAYGVGVYECKGAAPASIDDCYISYAGSTSGSGGLGNALYAITYPDGTGYVDLHVETGVTNSTLGCDATHPCSAVVVPAWGGDQSGDGSAPSCNGLKSHKKDVSDGEHLTQNALTGACAWANRLVVPLHFAPTPTDCPARDPAFSAVGSPMLERGLTQWQSGWCNDSSPLTFSYNSTSNEYQARDSFLHGGGALTSTTDVGLTTQPAATTSTAASKTFTYAPVANTTITVSFLIDDPKTRALITQLTLNARLVAKLLTQSYAPLAYSCQSGDTTKQGPTCDPAVKGNPRSIFADPEFLSLNPQLTPADFPYAGPNAVGGYFPTVVAGDSDLTYELTRWIASDKDAAAFLAGEPAPGGMHVNTYYKGIKYPIDLFAQLDPGYTDTSTGAIAGNGTMQNAWQPVTGLSTVGLTLVGDRVSGLVGTVSAFCPGAPAPCSLPKISEVPGNRSLFAIMDQGQASAYTFPTAHLVNAAGASVAPRSESIAAGLSAATVNHDGITRSPNFASTDAAAYPLTVTDYAMVRTCGQSAATATSVSALLAKVGASQSSGVEPGTLAPGYTPLTAGQLTQLSAAQSAVGSVACTATPQHTPATTHPTSAPTNAAPGAGSAGANLGGGLSGGGLSGGGGGGGGAGTGAGGTGNTATTATAGIDAKSAKGSRTTPITAGSSGQPGASPQLVANAVPADRANAARFVLPLVLIIGAVLLILGPGGFVLANTGAGAALAARLRRVRR